MNPVIYFEMPYHDARRAAAFYEQAFGWIPQFMGEQMGNYLHLTTSKEDACKTDHRGTINGGMFPFKADWPMQHPSVVIAVEDIKAAMKRIEKAGGKVLGEPMAIPGIGDYVSFLDTENNRNSILQPAGGDKPCQ